MTRKILCLLLALLLPACALGEGVIVLGGAPAELVLEERYIEAGDFELVLYAPEFYTEISYAPSAESRETLAWPCEATHRVFALNMEYLNLQTESVNTCARVKATLLYNNRYPFELTLLQYNWNQPRNSGAYCAEALDIEPLVEIPLYLVASVPKRVAEGAESLALTVRVDEKEFTCALR